MRRVHLAAGVVLVLLATACGGTAEEMPDVPSEGSNNGSDVTATTGSEPTAAPDTTGAEPPLTVISQPPEKLPTSSAPPGSVVPVPAPGGQVEIAQADLATRLGVPIEDISVVSIAEVTWRDGSYGCPQPGMSYTQALVNGVQIVLEAGGTEYHYHSAGTGDPFYCADPQDPLPPGAGGYGDT